MFGPFALHTWLACVKGQRRNLCGLCVAKGGLADAEQVFHLWLVVEPYPSKKYESQLGWLFPLNIIYIYILYNYTYIYMYVCVYVYVYIYIYISACVCTCGFKKKNTNQVLFHTVTMVIQYHWMVNASMCPCLMVVQVFSVKACCNRVPESDISICAVLQPG